MLHFSLVSVDIGKSLLCSFASISVLTLDVTSLISSFFIMCVMLLLVMSLISSFSSVPALSLVIILAQLLMMPFFCSYCYCCWIYCMLLFTLLSICDISYWRLCYCCEGYQLDNYAEIIIQEDLLRKSKKVLRKLHQN